MPDDRMLHRCQGHSAKLAKCDHLTYRVWTQYLLSSDDYGVMPSAAALIRGDNFALAREPEAEISTALSTLQRLGLVVSFEHQGQPFLCSLEWQDYQGIRWPRTTYYPAPSPEVLRQCSAETRELFKKHPAFVRPLRGGKVAVSHRLTAKGCTEDLSSSGEGAGEGLDAARLAALWNATGQGTDLPTVAAVSGSRLKHVAAALAEHPDTDWWCSLFARVVASDFLCGRTPRTPGHEHWIAGFDWVLKPGNLAKILEGNFDNRKGPDSFSAAELTKADEVLRKSFGGRCPHDPKCDGREECKRTIVRGWKAEVVA